MDTRLTVQGTKDQARIQCIMHTPIELTFAGLVNELQDLGAQDTVNPLYGCQAAAVELVYSPSAGAKVGAFKKAQFGIIHEFNKPTPTRICIKKCIHRSSSAVGPSVSSLQAIMVYDRCKQAELLTMEMNCSRWAKALMGMVYDFVRVGIALDGPPPQPIPTMSFVTASLAIGTKEPHDTFLLEDVIDIRKDGKFVKYISNNSAKPIVFENDKDRTQIAEFLAFCQHVQYRNTRKMAFVSDFQGTLIS